MKYVYVNLRNLKQLLLGTLDYFFLELKSQNVRPRRWTQAIATVIWNITRCLWGVLFIPSPRSLFCLHQSEWAVEEHWPPIWWVSRFPSVWQQCGWGVVPLHRHGRGCHAHLLHTRKPLWNPCTCLAQWQPPSGRRWHCATPGLCELQWELLPLEHHGGGQGLPWRLLCVSSGQAQRLLSRLLWSWVPSLDSFPSPHKATYGIKEKNTIGNLVMVVSQSLKNIDLGPRIPPDHGFWGLFLDFWKIPEE